MGQGMDEPLIRSKGFLFALIVGLQIALPGVIAAVSLRFLCDVFDVPWTQSYLSLALLAAVLSVLLPRNARRDANKVVDSAPPLVTRIVLRWLVILAILLAIGYATKYSAFFSRRVLTSWAITTPALIVIAEMVLNELARLLLSDPQNFRSVVFAGYTDSSRTLAQRIATNKEAGLRVRGFFDDRGAMRLGMGAGESILGKLSDLPAYVNRARVDAVFVALPMRQVHRMCHLVEGLRDTTASVYYVPDIMVFDLIQARAGELLGVPVVAVCESPFHGYRGLVKRASDILLTSTILLVAMPWMLLVAALVRLSSPGPVVYRQQRYGLDGEEITVYKFRTMAVAEEGAKVVQAAPDDPRITGLGRFLRRYSLDELPQLINVLQGRMSLVGPRPHAVSHNEEYRRLISGYMQRHKVRPGMTGLAQVNGCRGATARVEDMRARVNYDLDYLRHWSPMLDVRILVRTAITVLRHENAY